MCSVRPRYITGSLTEFASTFASTFALLARSVALPMSLLAALLATTVRLGLGKHLLAIVERQFAARAKVVDVWRDLCS